VAPASASAREILLPNSGPDPAVTSAIRSFNEKRSRTLIFRLPIGLEDHHGGGGVIRLPGVTHDRPSRFKAIVVRRVVESHGVTRLTIALAENLCASH
jgi:hypothetical protein